MYIVYTMIIYHVLIKVFSFNSGVMLSSSFSDALLLENVFVIRLTIRARLVSPTSQKQRLVGWLIWSLKTNIPYYIEHTLSHYWFYGPVMSLPM